MSEYGHSIIKPHKASLLLSYDGVKEAKEKRRQLLEAIFQRRRENYISFLQKKRFQEETQIA